MLEVLFDRLMLPAVIVIVCLAAAIQAWVQYFYPGILGPITLSIILSISAVYAVWRMAPAIKQMDQLSLGKRGEEAVGQFLEERLRPHGYQILHDIPGDGFNVDHVVIGTSGIYTVETKTHSKPAKGSAEIQYDGTQVTVNGFTPDRDPIVQAKAQRHWLADLIEESTGRKFKIQPAVLYPGWFVKSSVDWPDVWVMNAKMFPVTITRQKPFVGEADVHLITYHLKRYVIAKTKEEQENSS